MIIALYVLGFLLVNVVLAYVPIILIVGYNLRPREVKDALLERYLNDEISTDEYIAEVEREYEGKRHIPLVPTT